MKGLLKLILKSIGVGNLLVMVWEMAHEKLAVYVAKTENEYDNDVLVVMDKFIREFASHQA